MSDAPVSDQSVSDAAAPDAVGTTPTRPARPPRRRRRRALGHVPALDGFRGVAVLLVLTWHLPVLSLWWLTRRPGGGLFGVDMFLVLSGFLITGLLLRESARTGRVRIGAFYRRRALRLLPALVVLLGAWLVYGGVSAIEPRTEPATSLSVLFYYSNTRWSPGVFEFTYGLGHLWTLSLEEQFYMLWPLCFAALFAWRRSAVAAVGGTVLAIVTVWAVRSALYFDGMSTQTLYRSLFSRADSLLIGALVAQLWTRGFAPRRGVKPAAWIALGGFVYAAWRGLSWSFLSRGGYTLLALAVGVMILAVVDTDWSPRRVLEWAPLRGVGRISYGLYLWHIPVYIVVQRTFPDLPTWPRTALALGATFAVTLGSWHLVEQPFLRWKDRIERRARAGVGASAPADPGAVAVTDGGVGT
ncbi:MAG: acyltransferase family protein [Actinomycetota bacterium]